MPANWVSFIKNVSQKFESQGIKDSDELSDFLTQQYIDATVNKAQSPFGNVHQRGKDDIMKSAFSEAFKMLEKERSPSFEEKEKDPQYADLEEPLPEVDAEGAAAQVELDFRDWVEANKDTIPPFTYSQFFSQFPGFPKDRKQAVREIARKIIFDFSRYRSDSYIQWIYSLRYGSYSDWGIEVINEISKIIKEETSSNIKVGDEVQGYAKYIDSVRLSGTGSASTVRRTEENSNIDDTNKLAKDNVILSGKIVSVSNPGTSSATYSISFYKSSAKKYFVKELKPDSVQRKLNFNDFSRTLEDINITDRILQEDNVSNPDKIPTYLTESFIVKFSYAPGSDDNLLEKIFRLPDGFNLRDKLNINSLSTQDVIRALSTNYNVGSEVGNLVNNILSTINSDYNVLSHLRGIKTTQYLSEKERYRNLRIRWIEEIAEEAKKQEDPDKPDDPYHVMAKGIIDYWKSTLDQPLSANPPVLPALILPPQGGKFLPIYYGSQSNLANNLRRAFNSGKRFRGPLDKQVASKVVATAIAFSFAMHLLELKFIYRGGIPTSKGPTSMIGFVPLVF